MTMNDEDITQLQDESEWDFEAAERQRAPRGRRAIVSVGFKPADFALVTAAAEKRDQPVSQFIREAAIDRARGQNVSVTSLRVRSINVHEEHRHIESWLLNALRSQGRLTSLR
jgi:hypothetical protein